MKNLVISTFITCDFVHLLKALVSMNCKISLLFLSFAILLSSSCSKSISYSVVEYDVFSHTGNWTGNMNYYSNGTMSNRLVQDPSANESISSFIVPNGKNLKLLVVATPTTAGDTITINILVNQKLVSTNNPRTSYIATFTVN
jgi:hypothetical protein